MSHRVWLADNLAAIMSRLEWLHEKPDGLLHLEGSDSEFIILTKTRSELYLRLVDPAKPNFQLVQSQLNLSQPLYLASRYKQAMLLSLLWPSNLVRLCLIGLGGGRLPLILHHYLPQLVIDCVEVNPAMLQLATKFFGLQPDDRLTVTIADGLAYLNQPPPAQLYDIILVDAFSAQGQTPDHLADRRFFSACQQRLSPVGVIAVNMLDSDPLCVEKIRTMQTIFEQLYLCPLLDGNRVVYATQGLPLLTATELVERATTVQETHHFSFPILKRANEIISGAALTEHLLKLKQAEITAPLGKST